MKTKRLSLSTAQIIMLSFLCAILLGSILLSLPISSASGKSVGYIDALFTATTATCVTGLVTLPTVSTWSIFGQVVILILIQIGGLGIITVMSWLMAILNKRISLTDRLLIQDAFNLNSLSGLVKFIKKVVLGTFVVEGIGALLYMMVFIPQFGAKGIWISIFNSISAFCNAGIDIISENSLADYVNNPLINLVTCSLIILGGIGFIVWWDIARVMKTKRHLGIKCFKFLNLHTKIVLLATFILIVLGALFIFIFEYNNPKTMQDMTLFQKIQASFFQSVTTRTAGFFTIPQQDFTNASSILCVFLMFIGGSPAGTAGGIKTVTIVVLILSTIATVKNKNEAIIFNRNIDNKAIQKAVAVTAISFTIFFISTLFLSAVTDASALDVMYETASATATVGLSRNITPMLNTFGKLIIIATMYLGRIGPISLFIAFSIRKESQNIIKSPTEQISVG
ncbi:MAG: potassium transporter KtrB [Clostridia bacterium]|nr:potassium transporter KtrB [Clostridia bacterium]